LQAGVQQRSTRRLLATALLLVGTLARISRIFRHSGARLSKFSDCSDALLGFSELVGRAIEDFFRHRALLDEHSRLGTPSREIFHFSGDSREFSDWGASRLGFSTYQARFSVFDLLGASRIFFRLAQARFSGCSGALLEFFPRLWATEVLPTARARSVFSRLLEALLNFRLAGGALLEVFRLARARTS
jgi:hypothetical protein